MAMILCPDCGKDVSSLAIACPHCGFPVSAVSGNGFVYIKTPIHIEGNATKLYRKPVTISGKNVKWIGELGSCARFLVDGPTNIYIDLGSDVKLIQAMVYPNTSYRLRYLRHIMSLAEYALVEV